MNIKVAIFLLLFTGSFHFLEAKKTTPKEYIQTYKGDAIKEMKRSGVPASITLAQGMLESGYGNSELAKNANNHFGIKCHSSWTGPIYRLDDDKKDECFRKYKTVWQSYRDHSDFLKGSRRYAFLFELKMTDYKGWCRGLKKAGYATNKKYATLLIEMVERYDLNRFVLVHKSNNTKRRNKLKKSIKIKDDSENRRNSRLEVEGNDDFEISVGKGLSQIKKSANWINYIEVKKGDTYYNISKRYDIPLSRLYKYNECNSDTLLQVGTRVFLQPKRSRGTQKIYIFQSGDTVYRISQKFGIKLKYLYKRNNWREDYCPKEGEKIYLKGKRK